MEPPSLNSLPPEDPQLEAWLRSAALPPLADEGFSARVLAALPARQPAHAPTGRVLFCLIGGLTGAAVLGGAMLLQPYVSVNVSPLEPDLVDALARLTDPGVGIGLAVAVASVALALWPRRGSALRHQGRP